MLRYKKLVSYDTKWGKIFELNLKTILTVSTVWNTGETGNIGLKRLVRMVASIPFIRCLCYKPERFNKNIV